MIFLSLILIPIILIPFAVDLSSSVLSFLDICDVFIVILFGVEYLSKLFNARDRLKHFASPWHLLDLIIVVLAFVQYIPLLGLSTIGSPSLLLRLLRLPRAFVVGGRAIASRRVTTPCLCNTVNLPDTIIRQVDSDLKTTHNLTWDELKVHISEKIVKNGSTSITFRMRVSSC